MVELLGKYKFILIFVCMIIMVSLFPLTGTDLIYSTSELNIDSLFTIRNFGVLVNNSLIFLAKIKFLRILIVSILGTSMFVLLKNVVNKRNSSLMFLGFFFFLLLDSEVFAAAYANLTGFMNHFVGALLLIIIMNLFYKNTICNMKNVLLLMLGFVVTSINCVYSITLFVMTILYIFFERNESRENKYFYLITGEIVGLLILIFNLNLNYTGFSHNLIRDFIPRISSANYIITFIVSIFVLFEAVKMFIHEKRLVTVMASLGLLVYLITSFLVDEPIINYIAYILNFFGSAYILMKMTKSKLFERKIMFYYGFKFVYIVVLCLIGNISNGNMLFLSLVDILIILELYNKLFPVDFLRYVWAIGGVCLVGAYSYIYSKVNVRFEELNFFMKNTLECQNYDYSIPERYETQHLYNYIPSSVEELESYIEYYEITIFGDIEKVNFHFEN